MRAGIFYLVEMEVDVCNFYQEITLLILQRWSKLAKTLIECMIRELMKIIAAAAPAAAC
jgi:hypothetical protein